MEANIERTPNQVEILRPTVPSPGVFPHVPFSEYHGWAALSHSWMNRLKQSPAHLISYLSEENKDTPALRLGRAIHAAVLEPERFRAEFAWAPAGLDRRTKEGKETWAALVAAHGAENLLSCDEFETCEAMRKRVWSRSAARTLLGGEGECELSVVWDNAGILAKARADRMSWKLKGGTVVDLKSTGDASLAEFERSIFKFGYHRQAAWYLQGFQAHKIEVAHFCIIAVEKEPPYEVGVYRITDEAINAGWQQIEPVLDVYRRCLESNEFPGYEDKVVDIGLPAYGWNQAA